MLRLIMIQQQSGGSKPRLEIRESYHLEEWKREKNLSGEKCRDDVIAGNWRRLIVTSLTLKLDLYHKHVCWD